MCTLLSVCGNIHKLLRLKRWRVMTSCPFSKWDKDYTDALFCNIVEMFNCVNAINMCYTEVMFGLTNSWFLNGMAVGNEGLSVHRLINSLINITPLHFFIETFINAITKGSVCTPGGHSGMVLCTCTINFFQTHHKEVPVHLSNCTLIKFYTGCWWDK